MEVQLSLSLISIKAKIPYKHMSSESEIFALDVTLLGCLPFSFVALYFPAGAQDTRSLNFAVNSCCKEKTLVGDFKSDHTCWGFRRNQCGKCLWELVKR